MLYVSFLLRTRHASAWGEVDGWRRSSPRSFPLHVTPWSSFFHRTLFLPPSWERKEPPAREGENMKRGAFKVFGIFMIFPIFANLCHSMKKIPKTLIPPPLSWQSVRGKLILLTFIACTGNMPFYVEIKWYMQWHWRPRLDWTLVNREKCQKMPKNAKKCPKWSKPHAW